MKREIAVVAMVVCLAGGFLAGWFIPPLFAPPSGELISKIKSRGELRVGTSTDYEPFEFDNITSGEIEGFDVDVSRLIADEIGVDLLMVNMDFEALISACVAGTIDMIAAALTYDPTTELGQQRAKQLAPSIPYITVAQVVITLGSSSLNINNLSDFDFRQGILKDKGDWLFAGCHWVGGADGKLKRAIYAFLVAQMK